jgi:hypothetical protein
MNKLLQSVTSAVQTLSNTNENGLSVTPDSVNVTLNIDIHTWRYFENLDEDSRQMMARVLKDYVEKQG